jgi:hypothetical protein
MLQKQISLPRQDSNLCSKCGLELHASWCARCFGTGRSGKHECKKCGGTGRMAICPDARAHKLGLFGWIFPKVGPQALPGAPGAENSAVPEHRSSTSGSGRNQPRPSTRR